MNRVFEHTRVWGVSVPAYRAATRLLAEAVTARAGKVRTVVGIARGGRAPAYSVARHLGVPAVIVHARHNTTDAVYAPATNSVTYDLDALNHVAVRQPLVLVDDICGSGATLAAVKEHLSEALTATLCRNAGAPERNPDLYIWPVADWVVFPWEPKPQRPLTWLPMPGKVTTT